MSVDFVFMWVVVAILWCFGVALTIMRTPLKLGAMMFLIAFAFSLIMFGVTWVVKTAAIYYWG